MKIIIAYAAVGSGHFKAAEAVYNYLKEKNCNLELALTDALDNAHFLFKNIYSYGYAFLVNYLSWVWAGGFYLTNARLLRPLIKKIHFIVNWLNTKKFIKLLIRENPDFIIATHFLPLEIIAYLKKTRKINSRLITVITDFGVHPFWLSEGVDIYIAASDFTKQQLILDGVEENKIKVLGIPTNAKFTLSLERSLLAKKFNLEQDKFTVLIITGSFGIGPIEKIVGVLYEDVQVLVVCARNQRLLNSLKRRNYPGVLVFGLTDNIEELMAVSDLIITKPGGLTISELLIMELAPVFIYPIPGQETLNAKVLESEGIGSILKNAADIKDAVLDYKNNPDKLNKTKESIRRLKRPDALSGIYNVICQSSVGDTC